MTSLLECLPVFDTFVSHVKKVVLPPTNKLHQIISCPMELQSVVEIVFRDEQKQKFTAFDTSIIDSSVILSAQNNSRGQRIGGCILIEQLIYRYSIYKVGDEDVMYISSQQPFLK